MQTTEIKIGDKVKARNTLYCSDGFWTPTAGGIYTVQDLDESLGNVWLRLQEDPDVSKKGHPCNWGAEAFVLVEKQNTEDPESKGWNQNLQNESGGFPLINEKGGIKHDCGKIDYTLLLKDLPNSVESVVKVLELGSKRYGRTNYSKVESERYEKSVLRHIMSHLSGDTIDKDSGEPHLSHAICGLLFLVERQLKEQEENK